MVDWPGPLWPGGYQLQVEAAAAWQAVRERVKHLSGCSGMTIAVRPPEYFPGLLYVALMQAVDVFVLADTFQYSRQSLQNRTRVRNPQAWQWLSVPLKGGQHGTPQDAIRVRQVSGWRTRHWKAFAFNYRQTPYFSHYAAALEACYARPWTHLAELNCHSIELVHRWLELKCSLRRTSQMRGCPDSMPAVLRAWPEARLLAPDGIPEPTARLRMSFDHPRYRQAFGGFEPGMTALDLLANYGPDSAAMLRTASSINRLD